MINNIGSKLFNFSTFFVFKFLDNIYFVYCGFKNLIRYKKLFDPKITYLTGADYQFFSQTTNLIKSINKHDPSQKIIFYDLGLEPHQINDIKKFKNVTYKEFDFSVFPNFISTYIDGRLGAYAWKPIIIDKELNNIDGNILWLDSACLLSKKPTKIKVLITCNKIFTTLSSNSIKDWSHPKTIEHLNFHKRDLNKRNFMAGIVGVNNENVAIKNLIKDWKMYSQIEDCISPPGSNRLNHRQDQSILSMLMYIHMLDGYKFRDYKNSELLIGQTFNKIFLQDIDHNDEKYYLYELFNKNFHNETTNSFEKSEIFLIFDIDKISEKKYKNYKEKKIVLALNSIDEITNLENKETSYFDLVLFLKKEYKGTFDLDYLCIEDNLKFFKVEDIRRKLDKIEK